MTAALFVVWMFCLFVFHISAQKAFPAIGLPAPHFGVSFFIVTAVLVLSVLFFQRKR